MRSSVRARIDDRQIDVRVDRRAAVPGIMLGAGERAGALAPLDPAAHVAGDALGIVAERAGLHDRIVGEHVEIGHRSEYPIDADCARLLRGDGRRPSESRPHLQARREPRGGGNSVRPVDLLTCASLEVGGKKQRAARLA